MKHQYMTDEEIQAAEQRCQQATPGELKFDSGLVPPDGPQTYCEVYTDDETIIAEVNDKITEGKSNGEFMSHARTDLPKALSDLRELRRVVGELVKWFPFDSAPTDGTEILVWREDAGIFMASFRPSAGDDGEFGPQMNGEECWFDNYGNDLTGDLPTYWKPKPSPPVFNAALALAQQVEGGK